jgi:hypothetical protein
MLGICMTLRQTRATHGSASSYNLKIEDFAHLGRVACNPCRLCSGSIFEACFQTKLFFPVTYLGQVVCNHIGSGSRSIFGAHFQT